MISPKQIRDKNKYFSELWKFAEKAFEFQNSNLLYHRVAYPGGEASFRDHEEKIWPDDTWKKIFRGGPY